MTGKENLKCSHTIQTPNRRINVMLYNPCHHKVVAIVKLRSGVTGKFVTHNVCKMHLNSTKKHAERLKNRLDYDVELKINNL